MLQRFFGLAGGKSSQAADRRAGRRVTVALPGVLSGHGCADEVSVVNLSDGGAMIATTLPLVVNERFLLTVEGWGAVPVVVRWARQGHAGLAFER